MWNELHDLNKRLAQAAEQKAQADKLQRRLETLQQEKQDLDHRMYNLQQAVGREEADVRRLEGLSLTGLFYTILGSKDEQLYKERQEALAAQLKYDHAVGELETLDRELQRVRAEWQNAHQSHDDYASLLEQKEQLIRTHQSGAAELFRLGEQEQQLQWQAKELNEAWGAGRNADAALGKVEECLSSAQGWGTWDMLGGGMIATAMKHSRIDEARSYVHAAQGALAGFRRELNDVAMVIHVDEIQIGGFATFADYFFDGLIADWIIQSRINESMESARRSRSQVGHVLHIISEKLRETQAQLSATQQERQAFIAGFGG
ncbi:MAG: hypothetical protein K0R39_3245 [Symbiobacteriaceae bacterium]|jgi:hypothetical protein|nr:hypothetical protein [Symbiobacteriaceae bacterium]